MNSDRLTTTLYGRCFSSAYENIPVVTAIARRADIVFFFFIISPKSVYFAVLHLYALFPFCLAFFSNKIHRGNIARRRAFPVRARPSHRKTQYRPSRHWAPASPPAPRGRGYYRYYCTCEPPRTDGAMRLGRAAGAERRGIFLHYSRSTRADVYFVKPATSREIAYIFSANPSNKQSRDRVYGDYIVIPHPI